MNPASRIPPRRPWWSRKRIWAAALLLLLTAYPASLGPVIYVTERGWLPLSVYGLYNPALPLQNVPYLGRRYAAYLSWWWNLVPPDPAPGFGLPP